MRKTRPTAFVTGAAGGIGSAICASLRQSGYTVIGSDLPDTRVDADVFVPLDLRDVCGNSRRDGALARVRQAVGPDGLSLLVNNAAVQRLGGTDTITQDDWTTTLDVNLLAPFFLTQALLPQLERARGSVVNIASIHAMLTKPGFVAYATSKAALVGLTRSLAVDLGGRVRVNAVVPAATATSMLLAGLRESAQLDALAGMHPVGRIARPEEMGAAVLYLASEAASFVTGTVLHLDGGIGARLHDPV
jgi:NAD(P)-dependent dehydrogenase (short-subunit alcohol dehydrogenase family)